MKPGVSGIGIVGAALVLLLIQSVGLFEEFGFVWPRSIEGVATLIAFAALAIAFVRSGFMGYAFWITAITAYPVVAPYIVRDLLGYAYYSARALEYQSFEVEAGPLLIAALASLFFAISVSARRVELATPDASRGRATAADRFVWLLLAQAAMVFFAWLTEPGPPIGIVGYEAMRSYRIPGTDFAGAAWAVFAVTSLGVYLDIRARAPDRIRRLAGWVFWGGVLISVVYLLMHARRSEISGYLIVLLCVFGPALSRWKIALTVSIAIFSLSIIGYIRNPDVPVDSRVLNYAHLPGAPGNILIGYIVAYELGRKGEISIVPGETYLGHIERIPPAALGLSRPETAYDRVNEKEPLSGGEFYLIEPYLNFGVPGIVMYLAGLTLLFNWAIGGIARYAGNMSGIARFIIVGTLTTMVFRMLWYGIGGTVKAMIIVSLVSLVISTVVYGAAEARRKRPRQGLERRRLDHT